MQVHGGGKAGMLFQLGVKVGERMTAAVDEEQLPVAKRMLETAQINLTELVTEAVNMAAGLDRVPRSGGDALRQLFVAQRKYAAAARNAMSSSEAWALADKDSARVRVSCAKELQEGGMSASAADKAASGHERYTAHKDAVADLAAAKADLETEKDVAYTEYRAALAAVNAWVELGSALLEPGEIVDHSAGTVRHGDAVLFTERALVGAAREGMAFAEDRIIRALDGRAGEKVSEVLAGWEVEPGWATEEDRLAFAKRYAWQEVDSALRDPMPEDEVEVIDRALAELEPGMLQRIPVEEPTLEEQLEASLVRGR